MYIFCEGVISLQCLHQWIFFWSAMRAVVSYHWPSKEKPGLAEYHNISKPICTHPVGLLPNDELQNIYFLNFYTIAETKCAISFNSFHGYLNWDRLLPQSMKTKNNHMHEKNLFVKIKRYFVWDYFLIIQTSSE